MASFLTRAFRSLVGGRSDEADLKRFAASLERQDADAARKIARRTARRKAGGALLLLELGRCALERNSHGLALELLEAATACLPESAQGWNDQGCALHALGRVPEARAAFARAVELDPRLKQAHNNLGALAAQAGDLDAARGHFRGAVDCDPSSADAHFNLGRALKEAGRDEEGDAALQRASALEHDGRSDFLRAFGVPAILDSAERALTVRASIDGWLQRSHGASLNPAAVEPSWFCLAYHGMDDTARYRRIAEFFASSCPELAFQAPHCLEERELPDRLKVGFISRYLHDHSIGRTTRGVIPRLSRDKFEVHALFAAPVVDDAISREIRDAADIAFVVPNSLESARQAIAALELDVLFYQDIGMDPLTYFLAFSRLAPAQCVGWGHPVTTGIASVDCFISCEGFEPPGGDAHYNERLIRMNGVATPSYYVRPDTGVAALSKTECGFDDSARSYFCPQTLFKLHPDFDAALARILRSDPRGIVYLLQYKAPGIAERLRARFMRAIPDVAERIRVLPRAKGMAHYYSRLKHADVLLDTFHFGGGNTSLEGLAFGTPIVTLPGSFMRGRHTLGMYSAMGVRDCIATSMEHYAELAVKLAAEPGFRADVSRRIAAGSAALYEDERVVLELENALLEVAQARRR